MNYDAGKSEALIAFVRAVRRAARWDGADDWQKRVNADKKKDPTERSLAFIIGVMSQARANDNWRAAYSFALIRWG